MPLFVITWEKNSYDFTLKKVDSVIFPDLPYSRDWKMHGKYQRLMHEYANNKEVAKIKIIASKFSSYALRYVSPMMKKILYQPPLTWTEPHKTFPCIYYKEKTTGTGKDALTQLFNRLTL